MTLNLKHRQASASALGRLDPRWKWAALLPAVLAVALLNHLGPALLALLGALLLAVFGRLPLRWYLVRIGPVLVFVGLFVVWLPFLHARGPGPGSAPGRQDGPVEVYQVGPVEVYADGCRLAALIVVKTLAMVTLWLVAWATAPPEVNLKAARALRVPGLLVQLILLTYRYIFLLAEELGRLRIALRVRGHRPGRRSYRTVAHVAGTLLVRSYERAERVGQAMRCRGFAGQFRCLVEFHTRPADVAASLLIVATACGLLAWDWFAVC